MASHEFISYVSKDRNFTVSVAGHEFISYVTSNRNITLTIAGITVNLTWLIKFQHSIIITIAKTLLTMRIITSFIIPPIVTRITDNLIKLIIKPVGIVVKSRRVDIISTLKQTIYNNATFITNAIVSTISTKLYEKFSIFTISRNSISFNNEPLVKHLYILDDFSGDTLSSLSGETLRTMSYVEV
jgi:hypothetical protein